MITQLRIENFKGHRDTALVLQPFTGTTEIVDDFDHALHPRAQMELVRMIKELLALDDFQDTQIIATTHSPYVLDEVDPSSVIAFALRDDGTVAAKPLSEHPDAASFAAPSHARRRCSTARRS